VFNFMILSCYTSCSRY